MTCRFSGFFLAIFLAFSGYSQQFKLEEIMQGEGFIGYSPVSPAWAIDGQTIYFYWNPNNEPGNSLYAYSLKTKTYSVVPKQHAGQPFASAESIGFAEQYFIDAGNFVRFNPKTGVTTPLFSAGTSLRNVQRLNNLQQVCVQMNNDLYLYDAGLGSWKQLTHFVQGTAPSKTADTSLLTKQQEELFLAVRKDKERLEWDEQQRYERPFPKAIYYAKDEVPEKLTISTDGRFVTFRLGVYPDNQPTYFDEHITPSGYTKHIAARAKVSDNDPKHRFGIYDTKNDTTY